MMMKRAALGVAVFGLLLGASGAGHADLITNGSFELTTNGKGQLGFNTEATGWSTTGYNFLFASGSADTSGATGSYGGLSLWGPNNGSANGMPAASPDGGNFVAADGAFGVQPITQTVNGLVPGHTYQLGFYWAAGQQYSYDGATTDQWIVTFGSDTQSTSVASIPSHGFSGWQYQTFNYTAASASQTLSFLANGTPAGVPPFALLDGVSMTDLAGPNVPEPSVVVPMGIAVVGFGAFARRRSRVKKPAV